MATVAQLINRSLKLINALEEGESPTNELQDDALNALNDLLNEWVDRGIGVSQGDLTLTEEFPVDGADARAIRYNLAVDLNPEYGRDAPATVFSIAADTFTRLKAKYFTVNEIEFNKSLQSEKWYDIDSGPDYYRSR